MTTENEKRLREAKAMLFVKEDIQRTAELDLQRARLNLRKAQREVYAAKRVVSRLEAEAK